MVIITNDAGACLTRPPAASGLWVGNDTCELEKRTSVILTAAGRSGWKRDSVLYSKLSPIKVTLPRLPVDACQVLPCGGGWCPHTGCLLGDWCVFVTGSREDHQRGDPHPEHVRGSVHPGTPL
jgi:hypothetical protein